MKNPEGVEIERSKPSKQVEQRAYTLLSEQKIPLVKKIFNELKWDSCIIFTSTKKGTDELHRLLKQEGINSESIHGDRSQDERNRALSAFKNGKVPVIVATDVLARGIDIKEVSIIINYDVPNNTDDYIHRIGRTGRYDKTGIAITFVTRRDSKKFRDIERIKGNTLKHIELPRNFGENTEFTWESEYKKGSGSSSKENKGSQQEETRKGNDQSRFSKQSKSSKPQKQDSSDLDDSKKQRPGSNAPDQKSDSDQRQKKEDNKKFSDQNRSSKKESGSDKKSEKSRAKEQKKTSTKDPVVEDLKNVTLPPIVEKAVERNKRSRKPAKGVWGIIKSFIPKF